MSQTIQMTETTPMDPNKMDQSMFDSGISSMISSTGSATIRLTMPETRQEEPQRPFGRQDSGICSDFGQLSISSDSKTPSSVTPSVPEGAPPAGAAAAPAEADDAWKEYYEPDEDGDVQLHLAIASGFVEVVYALIRLAPHPDLLSIQNNQLYAPLHIAVLQNQPAIVRRLVVAGAKLNIRDREGNTPLHLAARRGNVECAEALLKPISVQEMQLAQVPPTLYTQLPVDIIDLRNYNGEHSVHLAAMGGHVGFLQFLSWNNADMNAPDGRGGRTALHFAVGARNMTVIQCLIEGRPRGCGVNPNAVDWYGRSAYQMALANAAPDIAQYLALRSGCITTPPSAESSEGESDEAELCETDDWSGRKAPILLNSSA